MIVVTFGLKFRLTASLLSTPGKKFFSNRSVRCFPPMALPFSYVFFPGILFYIAFLYPAVCYVVVLSCLLRKTISDFVSIYPGVSFHPFNPLNAELNPICYLLALLGAHHFLHVSRITVKLLTLRRLMSYIYGAPILDVSRSHTTTQHSR